MWCTNYTTSILLRNIVPNFSKEQIKHYEKSKH